MSTNSRMASAVHIMSFIAFVGKDGTHSEAIARSLQTNPVVVRKLLKSLEKEGLVALRPGRNGGVSLARPPKDISLGEIYRAVESDDGVFALREQVFMRCPVAASMERSLSPVFSAANGAVIESLSRTSLDQMVKAIR